MYEYEKEKPRLFTDEGQRALLQIRDKAFELTAKAGAVRSDNLLLAGDTWQSLACIDRLVELGDLREITEPGKVAGQDRVFVRVRREA